MENNTSDDQPTAESQSERGDIGSRDTGSDKPSGGPVDRPDGAIEGDESVPAMGDGDEAVAHGGAGTLPPQNTDPVLPPYEGRQTHAKPETEAGDAGGRNEGAAIPTGDESYKSPAPDSTPGGATASPADEQPASEQSETELDDDRVGPAHVPGTGKAENKR
jgi:hypothetical protein